MLYKKFRIKNFKGIKDTTVSFETVAGASVFAFVGLNESGKTTILEAIHSFSPDSATSELIGGDENSGVPYNDRVPRHLISSFTGDVSVTATVFVTEEDIAIVCDVIKQKLSLEINRIEFPSELDIERHQRFKDGDFVESSFTLRHKFEVKSSKQRKWRAPTMDEKTEIRSAIYNRTPDIAYFPTFIFDFPERIFLTERGNQVDRFYRRVFQDILDADNLGHTIEKDIVRRVRGDEMVLPWVTFFAAWMGNDSRAKIQHVMDRASAVVTRLVFGRWNQIFGEDTHGKQVVITYDVVEGEIKDKGVVTKTNKHDVFVKFQIRDGTRRFDVNDRSLGFRWFFAFMLFTQFRVARPVSRKVLFLFDEPAANLHAAAQQKLIESFPEIAKDGHALAYSTHSHYMIEPKWLEQTFIVSNRADGPSASLLDELSLDDESLDVKAVSYRAFVNATPNQISYFQPILDRLQIAPAKLDIRYASCVVEGKSDYYILRYAMALLKRNDIRLLPALGATTFGALAALHVGWDLKFVFLLDGDDAGRKASRSYQADFGIAAERILTLEMIDPKLSQVENFLDSAAREQISLALRSNGKLSKSDILRFFQERLASNQIEELGEFFKAQVTKVLTNIEERLSM